MSEQLQPVRGTHDLLPDEMRRHRRVSEAARLAAECFGFLEMAVRHGKLGGGGFRVARFNSVLHRKLVGQKTHDA